MSDITEPVVLDKTVKEQNDILTEILFAMGGSMTPKTAEAIQEKTRNGTIGKYLQAGDPVRVSKESGVYTTIHGNITAASAVEDTFIAAIGHSNTAAYEFIFDGAAWTLHGEPVELATYGITVTGTPAENDAVVVHVQASKITFELLDIDKDVPANAALKHSTSFLTEDVQIYGSIPRCEPQALVSVVDAIAAGTFVYVIGDHCSYSANTAEDGNFGMTTPVAIPAGGKIRHTRLGQYSSSGYSKSRVLAGTWTIYDANYNVIAENIETVEDNSGTLLGTVTASNPALLVNGSHHVNFTQAQAHGTNYSSHAAHDKWLESDAPGAANGAIASWWYPSDEFDMPVRSTLPGFLHGLDPEFVAVIAPVYKRTAKSVAYGYGYEDTVKRVWVPSMTEIFGSNNNNIVETSPKGIDGDPNFTGAYELFKDAEDKDRIKYLNGTARIWFLRSPSPSSASNVRSVAAGGSLSSNGASSTHGVVAGLTIA